MGNAVAGSDVSALNNLARQGWANQRVKAPSIGPQSREAIKPMIKAAKRDAAPGATPQKDVPKAPPKTREASAGRFEIATDIPLPSDLRRGQKAGYPYADLKIGESFFVRGASFGVKNAIKGRLFVSRGWTENGVKGRRVWRVK